MKQVMDEFSWRILAVQRVFKEDDSNDGPIKKGKYLKKWRKSLT